MNKTQQKILEQQHNSKKQFEITPFLFDDHDSSNNLKLNGGRCKIEIHSTNTEIIYALHFENAGSQAKEAIYTFSLGADAQLIAVEVQLDDGSLIRSEVIARSDAEKKYNVSIEQDKSPVTITKTGMNFFTLALGTVNPGEKVTVYLHAVALVPVMAGKAAIRLATTIAPHYGNPSNEGIEPIEVPITNFFIERYFDVLVILGAGFAKSSIVQPPYSLIEEDQTLEQDYVDNWVHQRNDGSKGGLQIIKKNDNKATYQSCYRATTGWKMDQDFVLELHKSVEQGWVNIVADPFEENGAIACVNLYLNGDTAKDKRVVNTHVVVDCSGSMSGDSSPIAIAALKQFAKHIDNKANISLSVFGTEYQNLFSNCHQEDLLETIPHISVGSMGGTNLEEALNCVLEAEQSDPVDILLISDGFVYMKPDMIEKLQRSNARMFCLGTGPSPDSSLLTKLADATGGLSAYANRCDNENIEAIMKHFISLLGKEQLVISKIEFPDPESIAFTSTLPKVVHEHVLGNTYAFLSSEQAQTLLESQKIKIHAHSNGSKRKISLPIYDNRNGEYPAIVAAATTSRYINFEEFDERLKFALKYQLLTKETALMISNMRGNGVAISEGLEIIEQSMATGTHGFGTTSTTSVNSYVIYDKEDISKTYTASINKNVYSRLSNNTIVSKSNYKHVTPLAMQHQSNSYRHQFKAIFDPPFIPGPDASLFDVRFLVQNLVERQDGKLKRNTAYFLINAILYHLGIHKSGIRTKSGLIAHIFDVETQRVIQKITRDDVISIASSMRLADNLVFKTLPRHLRGLIITNNLETELLLSREEQTGLIYLIALYICTTDYQVREEIINFQFENFTELLEKRYGDKKKNLIIATSNTTPRSWNFLSVYVYIDTDLLPQEQ